jgi:hypothetical protein
MSSSKVRYNQFAKSYHVRRHSGGGRLEVQDTPFDRDDGGNVGLPFGSGDRRLGIEHRDGPGFVTVAFFAIDRLNAGKRLGIFANSLDVAAQGQLVVFYVVSARAEKPDRGQRREQGDRNGTHADGQITDGKIVHRFGDRASYFTWF